jgi:adenylate kinase
LHVYRQQTAPVAEHYRRKGKVKTVDGMRSVDEVSAAIDAELHAALEA